MNFKKTSAAVLAIALITNTVAYAEDISTESEFSINFTVENNKGTYTFTDSQFEDFTQAMINGNIASELIYSADTTFINSPMYIYDDENSTFVVTNNDSYLLEHIHYAVFECVDIKNDTSGAIHYESLGAYGVNFRGGKLWSITNARLDPTKGNYMEINDTFSVSRFDNFPYSDDTDMLLLHFYCSNNNDECGFYADSFGAPDYGPLSGKYIVNSEWLLTENGAAMLKEAAISAAPETSNTPTSDYNINAAEALTADAFADVIAANADADVVVKADNGVSIKFAKGTMTAVEDVEIYDFTSTVSTDLADAASDKLTKDNFVMSIDYAYSGKLPAKAEITIPVGTEYAGKTLYYSRILQNGIKLIDTAVVDNNGYITVTQDNCSEYVLTTANLDETTNDKATADTGIESVAMFGGIVAIAGAVVILSRKKK